MFQFLCLPFALLNGSVQYDLGNTTYDYKDHRLFNGSLSFNATCMSNQTFYDTIDGTSTDYETDWFGEIKDYQIGEWLETVLLCLFGGIPWQCYYQRVLSSKTSKRAILLSYGGGLIAIAMTGPSVIYHIFGAWAMLMMRCILGHVWCHR